MLIDHHDQQIVLRKTQHLEFCFWTKTNQAKIEKILISQAILLEFLRSLVSAIWCEANKINLLLVERPIGSRAIKMSSDLLLRARGPALHAGAANAHLSESTQAKLVDMMSRIVTRNRLCDGSL